MHLSRGLFFKKWDLLFFLSWLPDFGYKNWIFSITYAPWSQPWGQKPNIRTVEQQDRRMRVSWRQWATCWPWTGCTWTDFMWKRIKSSSCLIHSPCHIWISKQNLIPFIDIPSSSKHEFCLFLECFCKHIDLQNCVPFRPKNFYCSNFFWHRKRLAVCWQVLSVYNFFPSYMLISKCFKSVFLQQWIPYVGWHWVQI